MVFERLPIQQPLEKAWVITDEHTATTEGAGDQELFEVTKTLGVGPVGLGMLVVSSTSVLFQLGTQWYYFGMFEISMSLKGQCQVWMEYPDA